MEEKTILAEHVTRWAHEGEVTRQNKVIHKLIISLMIAVFLIFISNAIWLYSWLQYDYVSEEIVITQDGRGINIMGDENEVNNGSKQEDSQETTP